MTSPGVIRYHGGSCGGDGIFLITSCIASVFLISISLIAITCLLQVVTPLLLGVLLHRRYLQLHGGGWIGSWIQLRMLGGWHLTLLLLWKLLLTCRGRIRTCLSRKCIRLLLLSRIILSPGVVSRHPRIVRLLLSSLLVLSICLDSRLIGGLLLLVV